MLSNKTLVGAAAVLLAGIARAEVAPGFPLKPGANLTVIYGNDTVAPPGEQLPRGGTLIYSTRGCLTARAVTTHTLRNTNKPPQPRPKHPLLPRPSGGTRSSSRKPPRNASS